MRVCLLGAGVPVVPWPGAQQRQEGSGRGTGGAARREDVCGRSITVGVLLLSETRRLELEASLCVLSNACASRRRLIAALESVSVWTAGDWRDAAGAGLSLAGAQAHAPHVLAGPGA